MRMMIEEHQISIQSSQQEILLRWRPRPRLMSLPREMREGEDPSQWIERPQQETQPLEGVGVWEVVPLLSTKSRSQETQKDPMQMDTFQKML
jgi:hypothetical protein